MRMGKCCEVATICATKEITIGEREDGNEAQFDTSFSSEYYTHSTQHNHASY